MGEGGATFTGDGVLVMDDQLQIALDAVDISAATSQSESSPLIRAKVRGLLRGYHERWKHERWNVLSVEQTYVSDLTNVDTSRKSRTFAIAGKLDALVERNGGTWVIDHKTTSEDIADPNAPYWRQLAIEGQVTHYMLLQWMHGVKPEGAIWDVVVKPSISPKKIPKAEREAAVKGMPYFGYSLTNGEKIVLANGEERESFAMYEARLAHDCITERPDRYFQRRQVPRLDGDILEYARELWQHSQDMLYTRGECKDGHLPPRNSGACLLYNRPCNFLGICSGYDNPQSDKWQRKEHQHSELGKLDTSLDVLTNSRIRCFQTCRRKEYYQYQLGIERADDDNDALWLGSLFHVGMEAWLNYWRNEDDNHSNGHSVNGIESPSGNASAQAELAF